LKTLNQPRIHNSLRDWLDCDQIIGARNEQQDTYRIAFVGLNNSCNKQVLLVLCDGMGGHTDGALASRTVADSFVSAFRPSDSTTQNQLLSALTHSNNQLALTASTDIKSRGMGSTLVAVVLSEKTIQWISVGDSILMMHRNGTIRRLNADHSMRAVLDEQVATGRISEKEASADARRSNLLSALTGEEIAKIDAPQNAIDILDGDVVILGSDGLEAISDSEISTICSRENTTAAQITSEILSAISKVGAPNQDNATLICHKVDGSYPLSKTVSQMEARTQKPNLPNQKLC